MSKGKGKYIPERELECEDIPTRLAQLDLRMEGARVEKEITQQLGQSAAKKVIVTDKEKKKNILKETEARSAAKQDKYDALKDERDYQLTGLAEKYATPKK